MGINVNVNPKKLDAFGDYMDGFSDKIQRKCNDLASAVQSLGSRTDSASMREINAMLADIEDILQHRAKPAFARISDNAKGYSKYLKELRRISGVSD